MLAFAGLGSLLTRTIPSFTVSLYGERERGVEGTTLMALDGETLQPTETKYFDWHEKPAYFGDYLRMLGADGRDPGDVLDVGCGQAWLSEYATRYTGMDASLTAVNQAKEKGRNVVHGSANEAFPFADHSFDTVFMKDVLEHLSNPVSAVEEALRVLRPGGRLFLFAPDAQRWVWDDYTHHRPYTQTAIRRLLLDYGAEVRQVGYEPIMPGVGAWCRMFRTTRRPAVFWWLARISWFRRNVYAIADKK